GGAWFLERVVGHQRAAELTFTARTVDADEAKALGILLEVTTVEALMPRVRELARAIAEKPRVALCYAKRLLRLAQQQSLAEHLEVCSTYMALCAKSEDHAQALAAFFDKFQKR